MPVWLAELMLVALVLYVGIGQILIPIAKGTPIFPRFRKPQALYETLDKERQRREEKAIKKEIQKERNHNAHQPW